jgi:hypothetical protein
MMPHGDMYESTFLVYYPENNPGERLLIVGLLYGDSFAEDLLDEDDDAWKHLIKKIEHTKHLYETERNQG